MANVLSIGGADPGKSGAIARIRIDLATRIGSLTVRPMPTHVVNKAGKLAGDPVGIAALLRSLELDALIVEQPIAMPGQSTWAAVVQGVNQGSIMGAAAGVGIPMDTPHPSAWKPKMAAPADKKLSIRRASQLLPLCVGFWPKPAYHDEAEAALLALYGLFCRGIHPSRIEPEA